MRRNIRSVREGDMDYKKRIEDGKELKNDKIIKGY